MAEPMLVKTASYEVQETELARASDDPQVEALRQEVVGLIKIVEEARAKGFPASALIDTSAVPQPESTRGCVVCQYTKVVNYEVVEAWPPIDRAIGVCGNCGTEVKSTEVVINFQLIQQIVEAWKLVQL